MKTSLKTYIKNTLTCIKYPFLYPRNRWDDKYHANILGKQISKAHNEAFQLYSINIQLEREETKSYPKCLNIDEFDMNVSLSSLMLSSSNEQYRLTVINEWDSNVIWVNNTFSISHEKFEILGLSKNESFLKNPIITIHIKTQDENDTTNYGFTYYSNYLKKNKVKYYKYKFLTWFDGKILDRLFPYPAYTEWDNLKQYPGWYKAFGQELLDEIYQQLKKEGLLYKFRIRDIKEKFGVLEIYTNHISDGVYNIISKYRNRSWNTCIYCGKPSEVYTTGWISPYCEKCVKDFNKKSYKKILKDKHGV